MKKMMRFAFALTALGCMPMTAAADEEFTYVMDPETVYELDLQGDGATEQVSYKTYTTGEDKSDCQAVLELYINDQLVQTLTDTDWSYYWSVDQCPMEDGTTLLLVSSHSDNDWTNQTLLLSSSENSFKTVCDLSLLSREGEEEDPLASVSGWGRSTGIVGSKGSTITVSWMDTLKATGNCTLEVTYELKDDEVTAASTIAMDAEQTWTAWQAFTVLTEADPAADAAYQVEVGDTVHLTELVRMEDNCYFKCIGADGTEGWLPDAPDYISEMTEDGSDYRCGYFEEAIYAG